MNTSDLSRTEDEVAPPTPPEASDDPDPLAVRSVLVNSAGAPPARNPNPRPVSDALRAADPKPTPRKITIVGNGAPPTRSTPGRLHDPHRIRGDALRRSLYFTLMAWIPGAFWAGATSGAPGIELAKYLGADDFVFSLLTAVPLLSVLLQIPGSLMAEWLGARKKLFIWTCTPHRLLYVLIGILPWVLPAHANVVWPAMVMVAVLMASMSLSNFGGQAWTNWMADLVPPRMRGTYFARRVRLGLPVICVAGLAVGLILDMSKQPWFINAMAPLSAWARMPPLIFLISLIFMLSGAVGMFDILSFVKVDEPPLRPAPREPMLHRLAKPLRDSEFRRFVAYWSFWTAAQSFCGWIWWVYLLDFFDEQRAAGIHTWWTQHMYLATTLILGTCFQVGQFLGYPIWGRAVDRFGRKSVFFVSSTLHSIGWIWWIFLSPTLLPWLLLTQMAGGFNYGGQDIASFNTMLQFNRRGGPGYQAMGAVIFSVVGAAAALLSGHLSNTYLRDFHVTFAVGTAYAHTFNRYAVLIAIAVAIKYAGDLLLLPMVHEVGERPASHALRFVLDNTYGSLNTVIFTPLRNGAGLAGRGLDGVRETITGAAGVAGASFRRFWR